jgi:hypothetical protein
VAVPATQEVAGEFDEGAIHPRVGGVEVVERLLDRGAEAGRHEYR